jgi:hypothetical protein
MRRRRAAATSPPGRRPAAPPLAAQPDRVAPGAFGAPRTRSRQSTQRHSGEQRSKQRKRAAKARRESADDRTLAAHASSNARAARLGRARTATRRCEVVAKLGLVAHAVRHALRRPGVRMDMTAGAHSSKSRAGTSALSARCSRAQRAEVVGATTAPPPAGSGRTAGGAAVVHQFIRGCLLRTKDFFFLSNAFLMSQRHVTGLCHVAVPGMAGTLARARQRAPPPLCAGDCQCPINRLAAPSALRLPSTGCQPASVAGRAPPRLRTAAHVAALTHSWRTRPRRPHRDASERPLLTWCNTGFAVCAQLSCSTVEQ